MIRSLLLSLGLACFAVALGQDYGPSTAPTHDMSAGAMSAQSGAVGAAPRLAVSDQTTVNDSVVIPAVILDRPGYVAVHAEKDGQLVITPPLGVSQLLPAGLHRNVVISLKGLADGAQTVHPMVHFEGNNNDSYDFPGPDGPVMVNGNILMKPMQLTRVGGGESSVGAKDGALLLTPRGAFVTLPSVTLAQDGFVALHTTGADGKMQGLPVAGVSSLLRAGTYQNVLIRLDPNIKVNVGDQLWAMAHFDSNGNGVYEFPSTDGPVMGAGGIVMTPFRVR